MAQFCLLEGLAGVVSIQPYVFPSCPSGYVFIDSLVSQVLSVPFNILTADPVVLGSAFSSGFFVFLVPLSVAWGARFILNFLKRI